MLADIVTLKFALDGARCVVVDEESATVHVWNGSRTVNIYSEDFREIDSYSLMETWADAHEAQHEMLNHIREENNDDE